MGQKPVRHEVNIMSRNKWIDDLEDLEAPSEKESSSFSLAEWFSNLGQTPYLPWIAAGVAGVLLVFGLTFFLGGDDNEPSTSSSSTVSTSSDMETIVARLDNLENKVSRLTSQIEARRTEPPTHDQGETIEALGMQLQNLENDFNRFQKQVNSNFSAVQSKLSAQASTSSSDSSSSSGQKSQTVYTVKKGDNLYRIGLQFDVSVDQLRSWNGLSSNAEIYPGQKLRIRAQ